jgi:uroporphyrinogen decarboxylase
MPRLEKICSALNQKGAEAVWLHIAGNTLPILPHYPRIGISICNFDYSVDAAEAAAAVPESCLAGNIKPFAFIGTDSSVIETEAAALVSFFSKRGGFILSSGCEIPPESNPKMVAALVSSAEKYSNR